MSPNFSSPLGASAKSPWSTAGGGDGVEPGVWKKSESKRAQVRADLDAAYFHLHELTREDVDYILSTFQGIVDEDEEAGGVGRTRRLTIEAFDTLAIT